MSVAEWSGAALRWEQRLLATDAARRRQVQVPEAVTFATKPQIACDLIAAALDAGTPCAWVLADALYGSDSRLRRMLEGGRQPYVLAVRSNHALRLLTAEGLQQTDPAQLADALRDGARRLLAQAVEAEAEAFLASMRDARLPDGRDRLVRHGHGAEGMMQSGIGPVAVRRGQVIRPGGGGE